MENSIKLYEEILEIVQTIKDNSIECSTGRFWNTNTDNKDSLLTEADEYLYKGNSGICLLFLELYSLCSDKNYLRIIKESASWIYNNNLKNSEQNYAFYTGKIGTAYVLSLCSNLFQNNEYKQQSRKIVEETILSFSKPLINYDFLTGLSGTIVGLIQIYEVDPNQRLLEGINLAAKILIEGVSFNKNGIFWNWSQNSSSPLCGLSHGNAGISTAFMELADFFNSSELYIIAVCCTRYEDRNFKNQINNWPDYRFKQTDYGKSSLEGTNKYFNDLCTWCHGAAGIGLNRRLIESKHAKFSKMKVAGLNKAYFKTYSMNQFNKIERPQLGLCHGISGNAFLFLNETSKKWKYRKAIDGFITSILEAKSRNNGYYTPLELENKQPDSSLFLGLGGIAYFFIFCLNGKKNSILMPQANISNLVKRQEKYLHLFIKTLALKMYPLSYKLISEDSINKLSLDFERLFLDCKNGINEIIYLKQQMKTLIRNFPHPFDKFDLWREKMTLKFLLANVHQDIVQVNFTHTKEDCLSATASYVVNSNVKKDFFGRTNKKYCLFLVNYGKIGVVQINQLQSCIIDHFKVTSNFESLYTNMISLFEQSTDHSMIRKLLVEQLTLLRNIKIIEEIIYPED